MKNSKVKRVAAGVAALMMVLGCSGCKEDTKTVAGDVDLTGEIPETMTIFCNLGTGVPAAGGESWNDCMTFQLMEEKTGCHIEWRHPATGGEGEQFNMMMVSEDYPDAIVYTWAKAKGGVESYVEDGVIVDLTPYIYPENGESCMPNLVKIMEENPQIRRDIVNDQGQILTIPYIRLDPELCVYQGLVIRQDWLDKLGLKAPTNTDELYEVLTAFKTQDPNGNGKADEIPLSGAGSVQLSFFGTTANFHLKDGKVVYGPLLPEYKEQLAYGAKLFSEGLIDPDYMLNKRANLDAKFTDDKVGMAYGYQPSTYQPSMDDGVRKVVGIPWIEGPYGKIHINSTYLEQVSYAKFAVTTKNPNVAGTLKWLDEFYGGEGLMYANFGKEGVSYEMIDGEPVFTDYINNPTNGKTKAQMIDLTLACRNSAFPVGQLWDYYKQMLEPWGVAAVETWLADMKETDMTRTLSTALTRTQEEGDRYAEIMTGIETYVTEQSEKIITGKTKVDEWDKIVEQIKSMGIEEALDIQQGAYERYLKR